MRQGTGLYFSYVNAKIARTSPRNLSRFSFENVGSWLVGSHYFIQSQLAYGIVFTTAVLLMCYESRKSLCSAHVLCLGPWYEREPFVFEQLPFHALFKQPPIL